jgi:hypothetical protein
MILAQDVLIRGSPSSRWTNEPAWAATPYRFPSLPHIKPPCGNDPSRFAGKQFVNRFSGFGFLPPDYPSYRVLTLTLAGLLPAGCTSLRWTHLHAALARRTVNGLFSTVLAILCWPNQMVGSRKVFSIAHAGERFGITVSLRRRTTKSSVLDLGGGPRVEDFSCSKATVAVWQQGSGKVRIFARCEANVLLYDRPRHEIVIPPLDEYLWHS